MRFILAVSLALVIPTFAVLPAGQPASPTAQLPNAEVTFTKDVAAILQNRCQNCHRPDTFAPMSLVTYEEIRPWAKAIKAKVVTREMPPWFIDKNIGIQEYAHDRSLSDQEIATIVRWVDAGAPRGNPADMPAPPTFPDEKNWQFGKYGEPDLIVSLPKDYIMPGSGPDHWPTILIDPKLTEDRYIAAVQIIPTKGYKSIHHIQSALVAPTSTGDSQDEDMGAFLNEYAVGKGPDIFGDSARLIEAGTKISVGLHLHPDYDGKETLVNIALGLKFHPKGTKPRHVALSKKVPYGGVDIRPGDPSARIDGYYHLKEPTRLLSWQPHMHNRGSAACILAIKPSERMVVETLSCARFVSNWHLNYVYTEDSAPLLPAGTVLHTIQWYDNSAANKANTDPDAQVTHGQRTVDEMGGAWISYHHMSEEELQLQLKARKMPRFDTAKRDE